MLAIIVAGVFLLKSVFSSAKRSVTRALTVLPRVVFGSSASFIPFGSDERIVRASMFDGDGSNASPAASTALPL